jgi:hypothetical protein
MKKSLYEIGFTLNLKYLSGLKPNYDETLINPSFKAGDSESNSLKDFSPMVISDNIDILIT